MLAWNFLKEAVYARSCAGLSSDAIRQLQLRRFRRLVRYAAQRSPYYAELITKYNIDVNQCRPEDFPILTKTDVLESFDTLVTDRRITRQALSDFFDHSANPDETFLGRYYAVHTSGSSGQVGYYIYSRAELAAGVASVALAGSLRLGQSMAYIAAVRGHFAGVTMAQSAAHLPLLYKRVNLFDINEPFDRIISQLNQLQPTIISGYAMALRRLAEEKAAGHLHVSPNILQSGGDPLSSQDKAYIEATFGVPITNVYACAEHLMLGLGNAHLGGMYLMQHNAYFELLPDATLVTNLYNYTLPLIRYRMSDRLQAIEDTTHTLPFLKVANIVGRNENIPIFTNQAGRDDFISPMVIADFRIQGVRRLQLRIKNKKQFIVAICLEEGLPAAAGAQAQQDATKWMNQILAEKDMANVHFTVQVVADLPVHTKTGKFQLVTEAEKE